MEEEAEIKKLELLVLFNTQVEVRQVVHLVMVEMVETSNLL